MAIAQQTRAWFEEPVRIELSEEEVLADLSEGTGQAPSPRPEDRR